MCLCVWFYGRIILRRFDIFKLVVVQNKWLFFFNICVFILQKNIGCLILGKSRRALASDVAQATAVVALGLSHSLLALGTTITAALPTLARVSLSVQAGLGAVARDVSSLAAVVARAVIVGLETLRLRVRAVARQMAELLALVAVFSGLSALASSSDSCVGTTQSRAK